jgi:hypothetical protein
VASRDLVGRRGCDEQPGEESLLTHSEQVRRAGDRLARRRRLDSIERGDDAGVIGRSPDTSSGFLARTRSQCNGKPEIEPDMGATVRFVLQPDDCAR